VKILITGATGFVGRNLSDLLRPRHVLRLAVRNPLPAQGVHAADEVVAVGAIDGETDWSTALAGVDVVVHLANRAHVMRETVADPLQAFRTVNVEGTRSLAEQASAAGVRRLIYLSSVKVLGESTPDRPFDESSQPAPEDAYGQSKLEAEQALCAVAAKTGLEVVVLRPPLVYGPGVGANFMRLMRLVARGLPLPLGAVRNRRSLIHVRNLASAIEVCLTHERAAGQTFLVSDGEAFSTAQLISMLAAGLGVADRSWALPPGLLRFAATCAGLKAQASRLLDSLVVDDAAIRRELGWVPPLSSAEGVRDTAAASRGSRA